MKRNVDGIERLARIILGLAVLALAFVGPRSSWAFLGIIPMASGLLGWCPLYSLFGLSTCGDGT